MSQILFIQKRTLAWDVDRIYRGRKQEHREKYKAQIIAKKPHPRSPLKYELVEELLALGLAALKGNGNGAEKQG